MLYRNLHINLEKKVGAAAEILRCLESGRKTQAFFRAVVHSVALDAWITSRKPWTDEEFDKVVSACGGVEYLLLIAFFTDSNPEANLEPLLRAIRPTHCFLLSDDPGPTLVAYPGFAERMTHFTMLCFFPPDSDAPENHLNFCNPRNVDNLRLIPSLKHLATALPSPSKAEMAADAILSACPKLQTLVFLGIKETRLITCNNPHGFSDRRVVIIHNYGADDIGNPFWGVNRGGPSRKDVWDRVGDFLDLKAHGETDAGRCCFVVDTENQ
ncbi:hypothetical protein C8F01DRAFT_345493 [Mycena amicta]|nr:hypothetical protein C8F01DRAFT_345493 [Mycena amicta]